MNDVQATLGDDRSEEARLRNRLNEIRKILETAVCTEGCDKGVVMLSQDGPTHPETVKCTRCEGCGRIANSIDGEPWSMWESLPSGSDVAVKLGVVKPVECPRCGGKKTMTVEVYEHEYFSPLGDALIAAWELTSLFTDSDNSVQK